MKTIIAGSRTMEDLSEVIEAVRLCGWEITEVVSGGARGADKMGEKWAELRGVPVKRFEADWDARGKAAGPIRNSEMADYGEALVAIWDGNSTGTKDMIMKARKRGLPVYIHRIKPDTRRYFYESTSSTPKLKHPSGNNPRHSSFPEFGW